MNRPPLPLILWFSLAAPLCPCEHPNYHVAEAAWVFEEVFNMDCLSSKPDTDQARLNKIMDSVFKAFPNVVINHQVLHIRVDVQERKNYAKAPVTQLQGGGHGTYHTLARFEKKLPSFADLKAIITSPVKVKIIKELRKRKIVLLQVEGPDPEQNRRFRRCADQGAKMALDMAKKSCALVAVDLNDPKEKHLLDNIFLGNRTRQPGILIVFGKGKGLYFINDAENSSVIMETAQQLDHTTDADPKNLEPRLLLDVPFTPPKDMLAQ